MSTETVSAEDLAEMQALELAQLTGEDGVLAVINDRADIFITQHTKAKKYTRHERDNFPILRIESARWMLDNSAPTPAIDLLWEAKKLTEPERTREDLIAGVYHLSSQAAGIEISVIAQREAYAAQYATLLEAQDVDGLRSLEDEIAYTLPESAQEDTEEDAPAVEPQSTAAKPASVKKKTTKTVSGKQGFSKKQTKK